MPWASAGERAVAETVDLYAALIHPRTGHPVLTGGPIRWLHVDDDVPVFERDTAHESVLVLAARASGAVSVPGEALAGADAATRLLGDAELAGATDGIRLKAPGPSFTAWALPGVLVPVG
jgi:alpha-glucosidase